jgi:hypothetical protein
LEKRITQRKLLFLGNSIAKREFAIHQSAIANPQSAKSNPNPNPKSNPQSTIHNRMKTKSAFAIRNRKSRSIITGDHLPLGRSVFLDLSSLSPETLKEIRPIISTELWCVTRERRREDCPQLRRLDRHLLDCLACIDRNSGLRASSAG